MNVARVRMAGVLVLAASLLQMGVLADGSREDYARANGLRERYQQAAPGIVDSVAWIGKTNTFWYRHSVKGGHEFVLVDAATQQKQPAFDHSKLAASLSTATGRKYTATTLPFNTITFTDQERAIDVRIDMTDVWTCTLADYVCKKPDLSGFRRRAADGLAPTCDAQSEGTRKSPDGKLEARINDYNVVIREVGGKGTVTRLSTDGSDGNCYTFSSIAWSPDSRKLAAYRTKVGFRRMVHYVESSPEDQLQPKHTSRFYAKPGDVLDLDQPVIFQLAPNSGARQRPSQGSRDQ